MPGSKKKKGKLKREDPLEDIFKLDVLGYANSGKTSLCEMICCNGFNKVYTHSKSRESYLTSMQVMNKVPGVEKGLEWQRIAQLKNDGVPMWSEKSWECSPEKRGTGSATVFGRESKILSSYYVELADIPGSLDETLNKQEIEYVQEKGLWNKWNCTYPRPSNKNQVHIEPQSEDEMHLLAYESSKEAERRPLLGRNGRQQRRSAPLVKRRPMNIEFPDPQKQGPRGEHKMNQLVEFARITMGFIVVFDITEPVSWRKANKFVDTIISNNWRGSIRPPIILFGNMHDKLHRKNAGVVGEAFMELKRTLKNNNISQQFGKYDSPSIEFAIGSVKCNYVSFLTKFIDPEDDGSDGMGASVGAKEMREAVRYPLEELIHRAVSKKFNNGWDSQASEEKAKSGIVYQAYRHCEDIKGGRTGEDEASRAKKMGRSRRGCLQSVWRGARTCFKAVFGCPYYFCAALCGTSKNFKKDDGSMNV